MAKGALQFMAGTVGSLAVIGGATVLATTGVVAVGKQMVLARKRAVGKPCPACNSEKTMPCRTCKGKCVIDFSPIQDPIVRRHTLCPTCGGKKRHRCLSCIGTGYI